MVDRTLLLVDGSSYLYRAYHALPDLRTKGGFPTGAIRGVVSMMKLLREQYPAAHGACVFDDKGKTFRDDWYAEYKATRTAMPDDLALQIDPIVEGIKLLGWPVLTVPGIEADDAIGTISCMAAKGGFRVVISTGEYPKSLTKAELQPLNLPSGSVDRTAFPEHFSSVCATPSVPAVADTP